MIHNYDFKQTNMKKNKRSFDDLEQLKSSDSINILDDYEADKINLLNLENKKYCDIIYNTLIKFGFIEKNKILQKEDIGNYLCDIFNTESNDKIDSFISDVLIQYKKS